MQHKGMAGSHSAAAPADDEQFSDEILSEVRARLQAIPTAALHESGTASEIADTMIRALPQPSRLSEIIGPCFSTSSLTAFLHISPEAVTQRVDDYRLLRLRTSDHVSLYPGLQFAGRHTVPGLREVLLELARGIDDPWTWAQWLASASESGPPPVVRLREGDVGAVVSEARRVAAAWAA